MNARYIRDWWRLGFDRKGPELGHSFVAVLIFQRWAWSRYSALIHRVMRLPSRTMRILGKWIWILLGAATCCLSSLRGASVGIISPTPSEAYLKDIKPVLGQHCYSCHGALRQKGGLRLDTAELARKGGKQGSVIRREGTGESELTRRLTHSGEDRMPPEGRRLSDSEIESIKRWIEQGAPGPENEEPEKDPLRHWSFVPPVRPPLPKVTKLDWHRNPIDYFVAEALDREGLVAQPETAREVLLRRAYIDLVGVPPTASELAEFLQDALPDAYERVVDRLLESPQHGERWARHWMDVWRYADWYGRRQVPDVWNSAPQVWRWRDWIVRSLNRNHPYDRMVHEMIAGDESAPDDVETVVATGYLVRNWYALNPNQWMRDNIEHTGKAFLGLTFQCAHCHDHKYDPITQKDYFRMRAFFEPLGLRQDWVRGEKDPGPFQKYEYSSLRKVVHEGAVRVMDENPSAPTYLYLGGDERTRPEGQPTVEPGVPEFLGLEPVKSVPITLPRSVAHPGSQAWVREAELHQRRQAIESALGEQSKAQTKTQELRSRLAASLAADPEPAAARDDYGEWVVADAALRQSTAKVATARADLEALKARIAADQARFGETLAPTNTLVTLAGNAEVRRRHQESEEQLLKAEVALQLLKVEQQMAGARRQTSGQELKIKADEKTVLEKAQQTVAEALKRTTLLKEELASGASAATNYTGLGPSYLESSTGRRSGLATWMGSTKNPLTARVAVNHVWMRHFHEPLVPTVNDFGRAGRPPANPALLDWLAVEFMESGWQMKRLHRLIVTSGTYRRTSRADHETNMAKDPANRFLWRMNTGRMEAEVVRDSILHLAGSLDGTLGGRPLSNNEAETSLRRSLYFECYPEVGGASPMAALFDPPDPSECYRRTRTVTPQQSLALSNGKLVETQAARIAARWADSPGSKSFNNLVDRAFREVLGRDPGLEEKRLAVEFLQRRSDGDRDGSGASASTGSVRNESGSLRVACEGLARVLFNHNDFVTIR